MDLQWLPASKFVLNCPVCGVSGESHPILRSLGQPRQPKSEVVLHGCRSCGAAVFNPPPEADYAAAPSGQGAALAFYLQQGAGLWSIASSLLTIDQQAEPGSPPRRRLLEIGCGFGFGLDIARRTLGWEVQGYDPSPFAAAGQEILGLPIASAYFTPEHALDGAWDVVLASEVLEHLDHPVEFLRTLHRSLKPDGVLVLTTPDLGAVQPGTPEGLLIPLLSVGYHAVLHTKGSLAVALREAGFATVDVELRGAQLLAHASNGAAAWRQPRESDRATYRCWLAQAAAAQPSGSDLQLGLLGRAYREAVNGGDRAAADRLLPGLDDALRSRFGTALSEWMDAGKAKPPTGLDGLMARGTLALGPLLLTLGLHRLLAGTARPDLAALFDTAAMEADALRQALQAIGSDDGDAEEVAWTARAEAALCAAAGGAMNLGMLLDRLGPAPSADIHRGTARAASLRRRAYVELVNGGAYAAAKAVSDVVGPALARAGAPGVLLDDSEIDVLYCGAIAEANGGPQADIAAAIRMLRALRAAALRRLSVGVQAGGSAAGLLWHAVGLELELLRRSGRMSEGAALLSQGVPAMTSHPGVPPIPPELQAVLR
jgi:SAM-dependent methyltransferase